MLSILITYYNQEKYVARSLDSVFAQQLTEDYEVLIGDDGSTDGTCKIVNEYAARYPEKIKLFVQPRDINIKYNPVERASKNRLDLLKKAKGDFVCFLDGDDEYCDNTWLQESIDILKNNKKLVGIAHNYKETYEDGTEVFPAGIHGQAYITAKLYCKQLYTPAGTILFRQVFNKDDYEKLIALKSFDDNDITLYFLNYGDLFCVDRIVYNYYQNSCSIWNSTNDLEKSVIVSIDYEIIKKMLHKYHYCLLFKYYGLLKFCYKNKNELSDSKYEKYKNQCVKAGLMEAILNWKSQKISSKIWVSTSMFNYTVLFFFLRVIRKLAKMFKKEKY